jgi:hypothetical protein
VTVCEHATVKATAHTSSSVLAVAGMAETNAFA